MMNIKNFLTIRQGLLISGVIIVLFIAKFWLEPIFVGEGESSAKDTFDTLFHISITIFAVFVGSLLDRNLQIFGSGGEFSETIERIADRNYARIRDNLIPMHKNFSLKSIHRSIDLKNTIEDLDKFAHIDILFSFHPIIEDCLPKILEKINSDSISVRLLLANSESDAVKERFNFIDRSSSGNMFWHDNYMIEKLRLFFDKQLSDFIKLIDVNLDERKKFQVKKYDHLPDIPLIIIHDGDADSRQRTRRVLQGYYLREPAFELPFLEWDAVDDSGAESSMVKSFREYFEARWNAGQDH